MKASLTRRQTVDGHVFIKCYDKASASAYLLSMDLINAVLADVHGNALCLYHRLAVDEVCGGKRLILGSCLKYLGDELQLILRHARLPEYRAELVGIDLGRLGLVGVAVNELAELVVYFGDKAVIKIFTDNVREYLLEGLLLASTSRR